MNALRLNRRPGGLNQLRQLSRFCPLPARKTFAGIASLLLVAGCAEREPERLWGSGVLEAEEVVVSPIVGGRLLQRTVEEGDRVVEGALVALIDTMTLAEAHDLVRVGLAGVAVQRRQAETVLSSVGEQLEHAERTRRRLRALVETNAVAQSQLDEAETAVELAGQQVAAARTAFDALQVEERRIRLQLTSLVRQIGECRVRAPRDGTVLTVYREPGEVVAPGMPIARIADLSELYVRVYIPAPLMGRIRLGGRARIRVDSWPGREFEGTVVHIADEAEFTPRNVQTAEARADLVYAVKVAVPNPDGELKIGLPADVDLPEIVP
jgi:HlyD family secretion protein